MSRGKQKKKKKKNIPSGKPRTASTPAKPKKVLPERKWLIGATVELILASVLFGVEQGWAMSGIPANIIIACAIWAICLVLSIHAFWILVRWSSWIKSVLSAAAIAVIIWFSWNPVRKQFIKEYFPEPVRQYLVPSTEITSSEENGYQVLLGSQCFLLEENTEGTFIRTKRENLLSAKVKNNQLYIDANIYNSDGKKVVEIKSNDQAAFSDLEYSTKNPDASTLEIRDDEGNLVLHIRYINPQLIRIQGHFYTANKTEIKIDEEKTTYGKNKQPKPVQFSNICLQVDKNYAAIDLD